MTEQTVGDIGDARSLQPLRLSVELSDELDNVFVRRIGANDKVVPIEMLVENGIVLRTGTKHDRASCGAFIKAVTNLQAIIELFGVVEIGNIGDEVFRPFRRVRKMRPVIARIAIFRLKECVIGIIEARLVHGLQQGRMVLGAAASDAENVNVALWKERKWREFLRIDSESQEGTRNTGQLGHHLNGMACADKNMIELAKGASQIGLARQAVGPDFRDVTRHLRTAFPQIRDARHDKCFARRRQNCEQKIIILFQSVPAQGWGQEGRGNRGNWQSGIEASRNLSAQTVETGGW